MRRGMRVWLIVAVLALGGLKASHAQEANQPASEDNKAKAGRPDKPMHSYRIDVSINELEDGKKINTRQYSLYQNSGSWTQVKISSRVSVSTPQTPLETMEVGTTINCTLTESGEDIALHVHGDFSNLMSPDDQHSARPVVRQMSINSSVVVALGKPSLVGVVDDPNSNRQFQLEATVTRLK
jgi:hypothetical protein